MNWVSSFPKILSSYDVVTVCLLTSLLVFASTRRWILSIRRSAEKLPFKMQSLKWLPWWGRMSGLEEVMSCLLHPTVLYLRIFIPVPNRVKNSFHFLFLFFLLFALLLPIFCHSCIACEMSGQCIYLHAWSCWNEISIILCYYMLLPCGT